MSVPVPKRNTGELEINTVARELCVHTLRITANEKIFTEDQRAFTERIRATAIEIYTTCWKANNIKVGTSSRRYETRIRQEAHAGDLCNELYALIEIAKPLFHLRSTKAIYWQKLTVGVRNRIRAWYDSDVNRLRPQG